ncbi:hypothetical protein [Streptomyces tanashiensis]|uniref:hypothetical protein n=1 Tax=Streptomyces tanashiensis TaxID=67367 RepID=UPI0034092AAB
MTEAEGQVYRESMMHELRDLGMVLDTPKLAITPFVLSSDVYDELFVATRQLLGLLKGAVTHAGASSGSRVAALGAEPDFYPLFADAAIEDAYCDLMARPDLILTADGPKFLEFNVSGAFGGIPATHLMTRFWQRALTGVSSGSGRLFGHDPFEARAKCLMDVASELGTRPEVALLGTVRDVHGARSNRYYSLEAEQLKRHGVEAVHFEPEDLKRELELTDELRYPLGIRYFTVPEWRGHGISFEPIRAAERAGWTLLPPQTCGLLTNKKALAWLSRGQSWMNSIDREVVERYIPWTRLVRDEQVVWRGRRWPLVKLLRENREEFVIKKATGMQGLQVTIGRYVAEQAWEAELGDALTHDDAIVQEYVSALPAPVYMGDGTPQGTHLAQTAPVLSPMVFGQHAGGCWARFFPDGADGVVAVDAFGALESVALTMRS